LFDFNRVFFSLNADDILHTVDVFYGNFMKIGSAGEEVIGPEIDPCVKAIKLKLDICQEIFIC
jgi:hypothetical protein